MSEIKVNPYIHKDGKRYVKCTVCPSVVESMSDKAAEWEMQHFHYADVDYTFLTCNKCKKLKPDILIDHVIDSDTGFIRKELRTFPPKSVEIERACLERKHCNPTEH